MKFYTLLALLSGMILVEGVVVELLEILEKHEKNPRSVLTHVTDLGKYLNSWVLPMTGLAAAGAVMLKLGETYPLGGLLTVFGAAVFTMNLVVFLICMTSEPPMEALPAH
jgi:hypothetical protein